MTRLLALLAIALGLTLIVVSLPRRRYITLSGHADGAAVGQEGGGMKRLALLTLALLTGWRPHRDRPPLLGGVDAPLRAEDYFRGDAHG